MAFAERLKDKPLVEKAYLAVACGKPLCVYVLDLLQHKRTLIQGSFMEFFSSFTKFKDQIKPPFQPEAKNAAPGGRAASKGGGA